MHHQCSKWQHAELPKDKEMPMVTNLIKIALQAIEDNNRIVIHCTSGSGKSGMFIVIMYIFA